jgi:phage shock protein B
MSSARSRNGGGDDAHFDVMHLVATDAPVWILCHYITQWRKARRLSSDDEKALGELWQSARRMEGRIEALEKVLDADAPGWRMRAGE